MNIYYPIFSQVNNEPSGGNTRQCVFSIIALSGASDANTRLVADVRLTY